MVELTIENFRHIEQLQLRFTDSVGRVRPVSVLVGPNTSGKTTVLDAIGCALGPITEVFRPRVGFDYSTRSIVRRGAIHAQVTARVRFSDEEVRVATRLHERLNKPIGITPAGDVTVRWRYPSPDARLGFSDCPQHWIFKARACAAQLVATQAETPAVFQRTGGVFLFDQQRTGFGKTISRDIWEIISEQRAKEAGAVSGGDETTSRYTSDARTILLAEAVKEAVPARRPGMQQANAIAPRPGFSAIRDAYDRVCAPHQMLGARRDDAGELDVFFRQDGSEYPFAGLSSGEQMVVLFLTRMVVEHIHASIVLVDEIELHQHPVWQRRLLDVLPRIGSDNQFILTTHSTSVRDILPEQAVIPLGELDEQPQAAAHA